MIVVALCQTRPETATSFWKCPLGGSYVYVQVRKGTHGGKVDYVREERWISCKAWRNEHLLLAHVAINQNDSDLRGGLLLCGKRSHDNE